MKNLSEETVNVHLQFTEFLLKTLPDIFILLSFLPSQVITYFQLLLLSPEFLPLA